MQGSGHHDEPRSFFSSPGVYAHLRHPQFVGLALVEFGFFLLSPNILALAMFPAVVFMRARLVRTEEREALAEFGPAYERYGVRAPASARRLCELPGSARDRSTRRG